MEGNSYIAVSVDPYLNQNFIFCSLGGKVCCCYVVWIRGFLRIFLLIFKSFVARYIGPLIFINSNFYWFYVINQVILFDLQVAFHALRFAPYISEIGNKLTERMRNKGPYLALHLRMEKDVWVRTGCLPGLTPNYDEMINNERKARPKLLTSRSNMTYHDRKLAGLCPLNSLEVAR